MPLTAEAVHRQLRLSAGRLRWSRASCRLLAGLAVSLVGLLVFLSCDAAWHLGRPARWTGLGVFLLPTLWGTLASWRASRQVLSEGSMARRLEGASPGARNELINAVMFDRELAGDSPLRTALFSEMTDLFPAVNWTRVLDLPLLRRVLGATLALTAILLVWAAVKPRHFHNSLARILLPASDIAPLTRTRIDQVLPGDTEVTNGGKLAVRAGLSGSVPVAVWLYVRETGGVWQRTLMDREVGATTFTHEIENVRQAAEYYVSAGDAQSPVCRVQIRPRTAVAARTFEITPPAYSSRPPTIVKDTSVLTGLLPGSLVRATLAFNNAVAEMLASDGSGAPLETTRLDERHYRFEGIVKTNGTYHLRFRDALQGEDTDKVVYGIKADEPPKITVSQPVEGTEIQATASDKLTVRFTATDDLGLASVGLFRSTTENPAAESLHAWAEAAGKRRFDGVWEVPLSPYAKEEKVVFCLVAEDGNNFAATPGRTFSRPLVVTLRSTDQLKVQAREARRATQKKYEDLIRWQEGNLSATRAAVQNDIPPAPDLGPIAERQKEIASLAETLAGAGDSISPEAAQAVRDLSQKEMPAAVSALRTAAAAAAGNPSRAENLFRAIQWESLILARLKGSAANAASETSKAPVRDALTGLEELNKRQRDLLAATKTASPAAARELSDRQDELGTRATQVRKDLEATSHDPAAGDEEFRKKLTAVVAQFGQFRIYEDMLAAAEKLQGADPGGAGTIQQRVVANLSKLIASLNEWQVAAASKEADHLREVAKAIAEKLEKLKNIQQQISNKSKEVSRRDESRPEDVATAEQIRDLKDLMAAALEKMLTDAEIFPDIPNANEVRTLLAEIYEDVQQSDLDDIRNNRQKPQEIAVQKEDAMLKGFDEAQKKTEEMEEWLPHTAENQKWLLENFDKTQFPDMPQTPLPEAYTDLVGKLLEKQKDIQDQIQDSASNQFLPSAPVGWEVRDGQQGTLGGQGKSGNEAPNHNEQSGRSSGGREGMSNGEMVGDATQSLEGDKADVRRTNDGFQAGQVKDDGKLGETRATGGGKAGGFSDRTGFEGNGPVRAVNAQARAAANAAAVQQSLLAQKTAKTYAQASMLYLKTNGLPEVTRLMQQSQEALQGGRIQDFKSLNRRIVGHLTELKNSIGTQQSAVTIRTGGSTGAAGGQASVSGNEGEAPEKYKDAVADYYRSLQDAK